MKKLLFGALILAATPGLAEAQMAVGGGQSTFITQPAPTPAQPPGGTQGSFSSQAAPPAEMMSPPSAPALAPGFPIGGQPIFGGGTAGPTPEPPKR